MPHVVFYHLDRFLWAGLGRAAVKLRDQSRAVGGSALLQCPAGRAVQLDSSMASRIFVSQQVGQAAARWWHRAPLFEVGARRARLERGRRREVMVVVVAMFVVDVNEAALHGRESLAVSTWRGSRAEGAVRRGRSAGGSVQGTAVGAAFKARRSQGAGGAHILCCSRIPQSWLSRSGVEASITSSSSTRKRVP